MRLLLICGAVAVTMLAGACDLGGTVAPEATSQAEPDSPPRAEPATPTATQSVPEAGASGQGSPPAPQPALVQSPDVAETRAQARPLVQVACARQLTTANKKAKKPIAEMLRQSRAITKARARIVEANADVRALKRQFRTLDRQLKTKSRQATRARRELDEFIARHGTVLLEPLYSEGVQFQARWARLAAGRDDTLDRFDAVAAEDARLVDRANRRIRTGRAAARAFNKAASRAGNRSDVYNEVLYQCLGEADWDARVGGLQDELSRNVAALVDRAADVRCERVSAWRARVEDGSDLLGYYAEANASIHLAPELCVALERLVQAEKAPSLGCIEKTISAKLPVCAPREAHLASALVVLAHEAKHLEGFTEEAQTQCYAIQAVRQLSEDLGFGSDQAQRLATYALGYFDVPDSYQSTECKRGGALDLDPDEPAWP